MNFETEEENFVAIKFWKFLKWIWNENESWYWWKQKNINQVFEIVKMYVDLWWVHRFKK